MREILFKAKQLDNGEWVEGLPGYDIRGSIAEIESHKGFCSCCIYEIDPDTICQYIGLDDKNDKKIWENDILVEKHKGMVTMTYRVLYDLEEGSWMLETKSGARYGIGLINQKNFEAVGNIFDNEDLLEVE